MIRSEMKETGTGSDVDRRESLVYVIPLPGDQFDDISPSDTSFRKDEDSEVETNSETSCSRSAVAYLDNVISYFDNITNTRTDQPEGSYDVNDNLNAAESDSGKSSQSADDNVQPMVKHTTIANITLNTNSLDDKFNTSMTTFSESGQSQANDSNSAKPTKQRKVSVVRFDSSIQTINDHSSVKASDYATNAWSKDKCNKELILSPKALISKRKSNNCPSWKEEHEAEFEDHSDSGTDETKNGSGLRHDVCRDICDIKTETNDNIIITEHKDTVSKTTGIMIHNGCRQHNDQRASVDFSLNSSRDSIDRIRFSLLNSRFSFARRSSLTDLFGDNWVGICCGLVQI